MFEGVDKEEIKKMFDESAAVANLVATTLINASQGQGHLIVTALAMVMSGLERQHEGTIKDVMIGASLLNLNVEMEEGAPPDNRLN